MKTAKTASRSAHLYVRVSTSGQAIDGVSLDAQEAKARAWADANGYKVAAVYSDAGISGKTIAARPGLQDALAAVCADGGALVVYSLSRLARSTADALAISERLDKAGADLVSLSERLDTTSAAGKMVFRMLAVLAEFERDLVSERTRGAMQHKRAKGELVGAVPFGKLLDADGVHLHDDPAEQAVLRDVAALRREGLTWQAIAEELNGRGTTTKTGRTWTWQTVRKTALRAAA